MAALMLLLLLLLLMGAGHAAAAGGEGPPAQIMARVLVTSSGDRSSLVSRSGATQAAAFVTVTMLAPHVSGELPSTLGTIVMPASELVQRLRPQQQQVPLGLVLGMDKAVLEDVEAEAVGMTRAAAPAGPFSRLLSYLRGLFGLGANAALPGPSQQVRFTARLRSMSSASAASTVAFTFAAPPSLQGPSSGVLQGGLGGKQATPLASLALQFTMPLPCAALTWGGVDACGLIAAIPRPPSGDTSIQFTTAAAASSAGGARLGADGLLEVAGVGPLVPFVSLLQLGSQGSTLDGLPPAELVSRVASFVRSERPSAQVAGIEGGASQFAATRRLLDVSWDEARNTLSFQSEPGGFRGRRRRLAASDDTAVLSSASITLACNGCLAVGSA